MKALKGLTILLAVVSSIAYASPDDEPQKYCWHDGKANSIGAVLSIENKAKLIRCSKVLITDKEGAEKEVVGWVEGEYKRSTDELQFLFTPK